MQSEQPAQEIKGRLRNIDPIEFEHFIADLWEHQGWETDVRQASNDMGVDVVAEREDGVIDQKVVIQAKRYREGNAVGRPEVQQYYSLRDQEPGADSVVVVTTGQFASTAEDWADEHNVKLVDGDDLIELLQEKDAMHILDEYAPPLREDDLDPVEGEIGPTANDELGVDLEGEEDVQLPEQLADEESRKRIIAASAVVGAILIWNPTGISLPVEALGTLAIVAAAGLYTDPEGLWDAITPTREVYCEFSHGGVVALDGQTIQYEPPGDSDPITFGDDNESRNRQRAAVYGALDQYVGGGLTETESGTLPTTVANEGARIIAAYRFAVHGDDPVTIARDMGMGQQAVIDHLRAVVS